MCDLLLSYRSQVYLHCNALNFSVLYRGSRASINVMDGFHTSILFEDFLESIKFLLLPINIKY